jgi:hypothetical protein
MATKSSSELWTDPRGIRFKISPVADLSGNVGGDWDFDRRFPLDNAIKHVAIAQRYLEGAAWEETALFRDAYAARIDRGESIRGCDTMRALLDQYYTRVDAMFADMKRRGFDASAGPLPTFLIGRNGEVFIGNQGNHRLAIARVLGLDRIAGKVVCRHPKALAPFPQ